MHTIARKRCEKVMKSFTVDSSNSPDTRTVRAKEKDDVILFHLTQQILTERGMRENQYYRIYENSFSRCRNRLDERGRVSLNSKNRTKYRKGVTI